MHLRTKTMLAAATLMLFPTAALAQAASTLRIAVVDLQQALNTSDEGKRARGQIEGFIAAKQGDIAKKEDAIKAARKALDAQGPMMDPDTRLEREAEIQTMILEYQQDAYESQLEMQNMELELTAKILEKLADTASSIAKDKGYDLVLEAGSVVFHKDGLDITDDVIAAFNAGK
jgi:outer membrane protein